MFCPQIAPGPYFWAMFAFYCLDHAKQVKKLIQLERFSEIVRFSQARYGLDFDARELNFCPQIAPGPQFWAIFALSFLDQEKQVKEFILLARFLPIFENCQIFKCSLRAGFWGQRVEFLSTDSPWAIVLGNICVILLGSGKVGQKISTAGTILADFRKLTNFYKHATGWASVLES